MKIDVAFTAGESGGSALTDRTAVVIDVLRATSTIVHALVNGAKHVLPVGTVAEAAMKKNELGRDTALLCGERGAEPIPGFDLGNAPAEFTAEAVGGRMLVMTTTNGTPALVATSGAKICLVAALLNVDAVARRIIEIGNDVTIVCAGREGRFALEDAVCAGVLVQRLRTARRVPLQLDDGAHAALTLASRSRDMRATLRRSAAGRALRELGRGDDVTFCAQVDLHDAVPVFEQYRIELS
ncbi:MAG: 2-phosphosulfolactate phosphatase [Longimicrobiales bacterium]